MTKKEFHKLFKQNYQELCRFAYLFVCCKQTAEDVVQKVFISYWENNKQIGIKKDVKAYLVRSVRNNSLNFLKSKTTQASYEMEFSLRSSHSNHSELDENVFTEKLKKAIAILPQKCRIVYCLKYNEGLSYKEIAEYLEISVHTVDNHIQKALKTLKAELEQFKPEFYSNESSI